MLRTKFLEALQDYQREEQEGRLKSRQRVERQLKIGKPRNRYVNFPLIYFHIYLAKPDATEEEVAAAVDGGGQQIFAQAVSKYFVLVPSIVLVLTVVQLSTSTRYGESRAAYREVQERQHDLQKVEQTLTELGQLFSDVSSPPLHFKDKFQYMF